MWVSAADLDRRPVPDVWLFYAPSTRDPALGRKWHDKCDSFDIIFNVSRAFSSPVPPHARRGMCSTMCACWLGADWCPPICPFRATLQDDPQVDENPLFVCFGVSFHPRTPYHATCSTTTVPRRERVLSA